MSAVITLPAWVARLALPLLVAELARLQVRARADVRWAPEVLRLEAAVRELRAALA